MSCQPCQVDPVVGHFFGAGLYAKESKIPAGYKVDKHIHAYTHLSILASGRAIVQAGDVVKEYMGPVCIEVQAGVPHEVLALTDVVWYCIHATDETDVSKVDEVLINKG